MNEALRRLGSFLYNVGLELAPLWPLHPEGVTRSELRAALADLRHLQGFLASIGEEHGVTSLAPDEDTLSRFAEAQADKVRRITDQIEEELGN